MERSLRTILYRHYQEQPRASYPIVVVLSPHPSAAIWERDLSDFAFMFPEGDDFYLLGEEGRLDRLSLLETSPTVGDKEEATEFRPQDVRIWPNGHRRTVLVRNDGQGSVVLLGDNQKNKKKRNNVGARYGRRANSGASELDQWRTALALHARHRQQLVHPDRTEDEWPKLVQDSIRAHLLTPVTSFIVVENETQRRVLKQKQEAVLKGKKFLDPGEEPVGMSEPSLLLLALAVGLLVLVRVTWRFLFSTKTSQALPGG